MIPSATLVGYTMVDPEAGELLGISHPEDIIELSGRNDYGPKSLARLGDPSIIQRWISSGEESMIEMVDAVFLIECSRVVTHELVRHRMASYQQESQRFVKYEDFDADELFFVPKEAGEHAIEFLEMYREAFELYRSLRAKGVPAQIARYVLPSGMLTKIVMKANLRAWRHIIKLRLHSSAQPEMRLVMKQIYDELKSTFPIVFQDMDEWLESGERSSR